MITRCPNGHDFLTQPVGSNCPTCALKGQYVRLYDRQTGSELSSESLESLVTPVSAIDLEAVPALELHGEFLKLQRALNQIRRRTVYLTSGDPGIGKSTLLTQLGIACSAMGSVLYVSAEEPREAVAERANRLAVSDDFGWRSQCFQIFEGGDCSMLETVLTHEELPPPDLVIVDSIQTLFTPALDTAPGSVSQVVSCTNIIKRWAREHDCTFWLLAHVTKDGSVAGPKSLEHLVDVVTTVAEVDGSAERRELSISKNRRGRLAGPVWFALNKSGAWREI